MFKEKFKEQIQRFCQDDQDKSALSELSAGYWSYLGDTAGQLVRQKQSLEDFTANESDIIDFGLCAGLIDVDKTRAVITGEGLCGSKICIQTISQWLKELVVKMNQGDKLEQVTRDIKLAEIQIKKLHNEVTAAQSCRREHLLKHLEMDEPSKNREIGALCTTDQMTGESIRSKKAISRGVFFTVDQKREHCGREGQLEKEYAKANGLFERVRDKEVVCELKKINSDIHNIYSKIVDLENNLVKMNQEISELEKKVLDASPLELENRIKREIEYVRDMTKLSAKRLHLESDTLLKEGDKFITYKTLLDFMDRIFEFDPHIFRNDRVNTFGKPLLLLVPGVGNALYDWKNNRLIVPIKAPSGNHMASIACGVIEYRLDVDEEKKLLNSYNQIPELKGIRSVFQLRNRLIKDYIAWMTSEYKGYRILSKDVKNWFEHQIAPPKNDIYTPPELQQYAVSVEEYKKILKDMEQKSASVDSCSPQDLWVGSIIYYQQGEIDKSFEFISALVKKDPDNLMALYNCGQIASKIMNNSCATEAFKKYCEKNPQSWWARIARDRLRQLQMK